MVLLEMSDDDRTRRQRSICETNGANGILFPSPAKTLTRSVFLHDLTKTAQWDYVGFAAELLLYLLLTGVPSQ